MYKNLLKYAILFYKIAEDTYKEFKDKIEQLSEKNSYPFSSWFGEDDRAYIDFKDIELPPDEDVKDFLLDNGYTIVDYYKGLTKGLNGIVVKIGKAINKIEKELFKQLRVDLPATEYSEEDIKVKENALKQEINKIRKTFEESNVRKGKKQKLKIVFSQNPHDVAKMSTDRSWESCMTLGTGDYHKNVFCEIENGGFIAYLIHDDDLDIEHPVARIHIRRFDNTEGVSIALPERTVYGDDVPGFLEAVEGWVEEKNEENEGLYEMKGGEYSDTYNQIHVIMPEKEQKILNWLNGRDLPVNISYTDWIVSDEYEYELEEIYSWSEEEIQKYDHKFKTKEEAEHYVQMLNWDEQVENENEEMMRFQGNYEQDDFGEPVNNEAYDKAYDEFAKNRFTITEDKVNLTPILQERIISKISENKMNLSDEFIKQFKNYVFNKGTYIDIAEFIKNYPQYISEDDIKKFTFGTLTKVAKHLPDNLKHIAINIINEIIYTKIKKIVEEKNIEALYRNNDLYKYKLITNETAEKIKNLVMELLFWMTDPEQFGRNLSENERMYANSIFNRIAMITADKDINKDDIAKFYIYIIKNNDFEIRNHAYNIAKLGEAGDILIPYLEHNKKVIKDNIEYKLNKSQYIFKEEVSNLLKSTIKQYNYAIDSIKNRKISEKYNIFRET